MTLEAGTPIGRYVVRRKIAEGGMAEIFLASARGAEGFAKDVAIKRIRAFLADDPEFVDMFKAEANIASDLNHANIVQIFDFDKHEDSFYIAMEYVRGRSLWDLRRRCREQLVPMPPTIVARIGSEVARGLHYAHRKTDRRTGQPLHLVHRDVTPHNVLLSWEGAVKLTDFGIAKAGNKLTSPGMLKGKFAYMSPEQARGEAVDARTDVFALGIVLWEMLTGGRLFEGDSDVAVLRAVQESVIAPPGRLNPDVHAELDALVMRALDRDVSRRFQTAQELERALGQFILSHAKTIDDTDVGAFLRRLYAAELGGDGHERTAIGVPLPQETAPSPSPMKREPTEVLPGSAPRPAAAKPDPDEDLHAPTWVVPRDAVAPARPSAPFAPVREECAPGQAADSPPSVVVAPALLETPPAPAPHARKRSPRLALLGAAVAGLVSIVSAVALVARERPEDVADAGVESAAAAFEDAGTPVDLESPPPPLPAPDAGAPVDLESPPPPLPAPDAGVPPGEVAVSAADARTPEASTTTSAPTGTLVVVAIPFAEVFIDGEHYKNVEGLQKVSLPAGKYVIRFEHRLRKLEKVVVIRPGRTQRVSFEAMASK